MPTILNMLGDKRPIATTGTDLFADTPPELRTAIAIRPGGMRMDRDGYTLYVDSNNPQKFWWTRSFSKQELKEPSEPGNPFTQKDALEVYDKVNYWSYLVEENRVWDPRLLQSPGSKVVPES